MLHRRDVIKAGLAILAGTVIESDSNAQEAEGGRVGPFADPTVRFNAGNQHVLPPGAFTDVLPYPPVPRPSFIGTWKECFETGKGLTPESGAPTELFGHGDKLAIGKSFHGVAREWAETPAHWSAFGCDPTLFNWESWKDKTAHFGRLRRHDAKSSGAESIDYSRAENFWHNWGGSEESCLPIKCYKIPMVEAFQRLHPRDPEGRKPDRPARLYTYAGMYPGPTLKMRLGQPVVIRYENHLETETSIHLHGGHSPSHSDGFPTFYVLQGKSRDYFYPNCYPLYQDQRTGRHEPDIGEGQSTMWYHDHGMDVTAYNVSKGLAGFAPCFGEEELDLIQRRVLPGLGKDSCCDPEMLSLKRTATDPDPEGLEDPDHPGFYRHEKGKEPYFNPYDVPLVLQDRVIDPATGQIAYDNKGHNGYIGDTMLVNGVPWPYLDVEPRKYRFRILDGSNARVFRLRVLSKADFEKANRDGIDGVGQDENDPAVIKARSGLYDAQAKPYLRIGKDSWLWSHAVEKKEMTMMMANRADIVVDFLALRSSLPAGAEAEFYLVNTMPQFDGRGPKQKLDDGGDPRVLPLPFDVPNRPLIEANRPVALMKFIVKGDPPPADQEASVTDGTPLWSPHLRLPGNELTKHRRIEDNEVGVVREFIFERGKGAWQINGRFYDPTIANATPRLGGAEEWVLRNGGGGWWHPIHIHLESHQLVRYEKDFNADNIVDGAEPPANHVLKKLVDVTRHIGEREVHGMHDTTALGPNTVVRIRMRHRTWNGPFVFHCHNVEHEDMRMMFNFEPVPSPESIVPNRVPSARTHGNDVTLNGGYETGQAIGELPWEYPPIPRTPVDDAGEDQIAPRPKTSRTLRNPPLAERKELAKAPLKQEEGKA